MKNRQFNRKVHLQQIKKKAESIRDDMEVQLEEEAKLKEENATPIVHKNLSTERKDEGQLPPKTERMNPLLYPSVLSTNRNTGGGDEMEDPTPVATIVSVETSGVYIDPTTSMVVEGMTVENGYSSSEGSNSRKKRKKKRKKKGKKKKRGSHQDEFKGKSNEMVNEESDEEDMEDSKITCNVDSPCDVLCVLFSMPLAVRDNTGSIRAIDSLNFDDERRAIWNLLKEVRRNLGVKFDYATPNKLRDMVTMGCRALHFSGHGFPQFLCFEDGYGGLRVMEEGMLRSLCSSSTNHQLDFVFVSACFSKNVGQAFVDAGVPHVVCVNIDSALLDLEARTFTRSFYLSLFVGQTVREAYEIGCNMVSTMSLPTTITSSSPSISIEVPTERAKFLLLPENGNHDVPIFPSHKVQSVSHWPPPWDDVFAPQSTTSYQQSSVGNQRANNQSIIPDVDPFPNLSHLPHPPEDFIGREADMLNVIENLMRRRFVSLVGESGCGKSAIAHSVAVYLSERGVMQDGIVYANLERKETHSQVLQSLVKGIKRLFRSRHIPFRYVQGSNYHNNSGRGGKKKRKKRKKRRSSFSSHHDDVTNSNVATLPSLKFCEKDALEAEEMLAERFSNAQSLIILDHVDDILSEDEGEGSEFIHMIRRLFERSKDIRVLVTSNKPAFSTSSSSSSTSYNHQQHTLLSSDGLIHSRGGAIFGNGIFQSVIQVDPLSLYNSLRLFSRLSPSSFSFICL